MMMIIQMMTNDDDDDIDDNPDDDGAGLGVTSDDNGDKEKWPSWTNWSRIADDDDDHNHDDDLQDNYGRSNCVRK